MDQDITLDDDDQDVDQQIQQDPDLAFLVDDPEGGDGGEGGGTGGTAPKGNSAPASTPSAGPALSPAAQAVFDKLQANPEALDRILSGQYAPPSNQPGNPAPPQPQNTVDPSAIIEQFGEQFEKDILSNPKEAGKKLFAMLTGAVRQAEQRTEERIRQQMAPALAATTDSVIESHFQTVTRDLPAEVVDLMRKKVEETKRAYGNNLSQMSSSQIRQGLTELMYQSIGQVEVEKRKARQNRPPSYAAGSGGRPQGKANLSLTDDERGLIRNLKSIGMPDKDIKQALKEYRAEKAQG